ncbi:hypothetical protein TNCV_3950241 [Trichonephila clavipes]|nr:hypothetical protein TNCV_3950241 [Trichonephila clavipes]
MYPIFEEKISIPLISPLRRLNEVFEKWRSVSFTDAVVHCPDFGSKSKFYRSRPSPHNLWETTRGPRRFSYGLFNIKQKLIKKVVFTDKFDDDIQKVLDESRSFFRVHTGYFSNIPKCIKVEFIASWGCSQSSVVSSSQR